MTTRIITAIALATSSLIALSCTADSFQGELQQLDRDLSASSSYALQRETKIRSAEAEVRSATSDKLYDAYGKVYDLTCDYQFDKALAILENQENSASSDIQTNMTRLRKGLLWCRAGYFVECSNLLSSIDTTSFSTNDETWLYYELCKNFYQDFREFIHPGVGGELDAKAGWYRGKLIEYLPESDFRHEQALLEELIYRHNYNGAEEVGERMLRNCPDPSSEYAMTTYWLGVLYGEKGDAQTSLDYYIRSAVCDAVRATKDNASLQCVALALIHDDVARAFRYTQTSLDDALFYNSRLRPSQIARDLPSIEKEYEQMMGRDIRTRTILLIIMAALLAATAVLLLRLLYYQRRLRATIAELSEANAAKEEFLALFLSQSSGYLDKLRHYLSLTQMEAELKGFYSAFDNAFVNLYPSFVEDFNALLEPGSRIELKKGEKLNTQLRVFALIRLGITQSSQIAALLRYSPNTIYNYRAQMKAAALAGKDDFEDRVRAIGK